VLSFFRSNQFFIAFPLALYVILIHTGALLGHVQPPETMPEGGLLYQVWFSWTADKSFYSALIAIFLVFIQAVSVNVLADEFRLMGERNWFPGLFYALIASALPDFLYVSAPLVAATFIPFSLRRIYHAYQKPNVSDAIFDAALWISVASLFYPPALFLLVAAFAGVEVVRVFRLNERFAFLLGAFVPLFLAWLWFFWADTGGAFRELQWGHLFQWCHFNFVWDGALILRIIFVVLLAFGILAGLGASSGRKGNQIQKFIIVLYWFLLIGSLSIFLRNEWGWQHLLLSAASMGILISQLFQNFRNRLWAELWHFGILLFILIIQFADFFLNVSYSVF
jgi:hypothetical protein